MKTVVKCWLSVFVLNLASVGTVAAQDIIVLNNKTADEIAAKIVEVSKTEVKYKRWSYQEGPTFTLSTDEIFVVKYQNGEKQTFFEVQAAPVAEATPERTSPSVSKPAPEAKPERPVPSRTQQASAYRQTRRPILSASSKAKISRAEARKNPLDIEPGFACSGGLGYLHNLDMETGMLSLDLNPGYLFSDYVFVGLNTGGYIGLEGYYLIPLQANARVWMSKSKISPYAEAAIGGAFAEGGGSGFLATITLGVSIHKKGLIGVSYFTTGEGSGAIGVRLNWFMHRNN